jgi:DNA-binding beta-propeller fold protein YncE
MTTVVRKHRKRLSVIGLIISLSVGLALAWIASSAVALNEHTYATSFAGPGSGPGQLSGPTGISVNDTTHDVYVLDTKNSRVEEFSPSGSFIREWSVNEPVEIAIDNSGNPLDPSAEDVYVVAREPKSVAISHEIMKFTANGEYLGSPVHDQTDSEIFGIAVDPSGELWSFNKSSRFYNYTDAAANTLIAERDSTEVRGERGMLAVDGADNIYISAAEGVIKLNSTAAVLIPDLDPGAVPTGLAVESPSDTVYVDNTDKVAGFKSSGEPLPQASFGEGHILQGSGVAVDSSTATVYVADEASDEVHVFGAVVVPDVETGAASRLQVEGRATLGGSVNPLGETVTACYVEYGTTVAYGQTTRCATTPVGDEPVAVSAEATNLIPGTEYHYRVVAADANGQNTGGDRSFIAPTAPSVAEESVLDVASGSATLSANVDPGGAETTYRFEYGQTTSYRETLPVPEGQAGSGLSTVSVSVHPQDLQPSTVYHYRVVVGNLVRGGVVGPDQTFTTQSAGGEFALPDGRQFELVSPPDKHGALIFPIKEGIVEAAEDGSAMTFVSATPTVPEPASNVNQAQTLSRRAARGDWSSSNIASFEAAAPGVRVGQGEEYRSFSGDLNYGLIEPLGSTELSPEALPPKGVAGGLALYLTENQPTPRYTPLITTSNVAATALYGDGQFLDASGDLRHVVFNSPEVLIEKAGVKDLYEWTEGQLALVDVLPSRRVASEEGGEATLGFNNREARHAISEDGSLVYWTDTTSNQSVRHLYVREMVTKRTVRVDVAHGVKEPSGGDGLFAAASADGSRAFFTDDQKLTTETSSGGADLYEFNSETGELTDLTVAPNAGEDASVLGVVGTSRNGAYVYFVATGQLVSGEGVAGQPNLYVRHEGTTRFVATLSGQDSPDWPEGAGLARAVSRVSQNGRYLEFMSDRSLTGYDNLDANSAAPDEEVYLYDAETNRLVCASCDPTGARPAGISAASALVDGDGIWGGGGWLAANVPGGTPMSLGVALYQSRALSDEGRLFFDSADALVPQDTNGVEDVYEYEPRGVGGCAQPDDCVALITPGTSGEESAFLDASSNGDDVFFLAASKFVPEDYDTAFDVYDAHVCSAPAPCPTVEAVVPSCSTADSCRSAPAPQPSIFGEPSSATFSGEGNLVIERSEEKKSKAHTKKKTKRKVKKKRKQRRRKRKAERASRNRPSRKPASGGKG